MDKKKEFFKNTLILFIGRFCTQFISLFLLPLYTHYLLTDDYGYVDLLQTYISLFVPVLILRFDSAVFRFLIDERENEAGKFNIISNVMVTVVIQIVAFVVFFINITSIFEVRYEIFICINIVVLMLSSVLLQISRGLGKITDYAIASIITAVVTLATNVVLIIYWNVGAASILISSSLANILCCTYVFIKNRIFAYIRIKEVNKKMINRLLKYSVPMIPNALSWWVVSVSDRTIITWFINITANGIYTVACRFSNILNSVFSIVNMSWQETASLHIDDEDRDDFFSKMINEIWIIFISISIGIIGFLPLLFDILIGQDYRNAYFYIPILLYANVWNVLIGLIGSIYVAKKKTKEIASTTIVSAIINIVINIAFIWKIGLYAASVSTVIAYMAMGIYRLIDCKKYVNIKIKYGSIGILMVIFLFSTGLYYYNNPILNVFNLILVCISTVFFSKSYIVLAKNKLLQMLSR